MESRTAKPITTHAMQAPAASGDDHEEASCPAWHVLRPGFPGQGLGFIGLRGLGIYRGLGFRARVHMKVSFK